MTIAPTGPSAAVLRSAERTETPALLYDLDAVSATVRELKEDLSCLGDPTLLFALKANRFPPLLRHLAGLGVGADAASPAEWHAAREAGMTPISVTGPGLTGGDLAVMAKEGALVDVESIDQLRDLIGTGGGPAEIGLRLRVPAAPADRRPGHRLSRFGVHPADPELHRLLSGAAIRVTRLHVHSGEIGTPERAERLAAALSDCTRVFPDVREVNLGGGLTSLYTDRRSAREAWSRVADRLADTPVRVLVEPGMLLTALAGYLVVSLRSIDRHGDGRRHATADASGWNLFTWGRPRVVARMPERAGRPEPHVIGGVTCYENDILTEEADLPDPRVGDRLVFNSAGAYTASMARDLHGWGPPREIAVHENGRDRA
jgi:diaminopimelate decarboxylase